LGNPGGVISDASRVADLFGCQAIALFGWRIIQQAGEKSQATGTTPARWLLNERLTRAKEFLENSRLSIDRIAEQTGFGNTATLRHHFRQHFSLSPAQYRKQFSS
jgi:AraC-like DNA-binding protein